MLNLTKPRNVFPFHGDHKRLRLHADLAESVGIDRERIFIGPKRAGARHRRLRARFGEDVHASMIFVDGVSVGEPDEFALRDRRKLSDDGVFIVVATISSDDGSQVADPEVIFRGVPFAEDADGLRDELPRGRRGHPRRCRRGADPRDLAAPAGPPRRHRGVRLREAPPPPAGPAGRRRGLIACPRTRSGGGDVKKEAPGGRGRGDRRGRCFGPLSTAATNTAAGHGLSGSPGVWGFAPRRVCLVRQRIYGASMNVP